MRSHEKRRAELLSWGGRKEGRPSGRPFWLVLLDLWWPYLSLSHPVLHPTLPGGKEVGRCLQLECEWSLGSMVSPRLRALHLAVVLVSLQRLTLKSTLARERESQRERERERARAKAPERAWQVLLIKASLRSSTRPGAHCAHCAPRPTTPRWRFERPPPPMRSTQATSGAFEVAKWLVEDPNLSRVGLEMGFDRWLDIMSSEL